MVMGQFEELANPTSMLAVTLFQLITQDKASKNSDFLVSSRGSKGDFRLFLAKEFIHLLYSFLNMTKIEGFCLKCKTYGPIMNGREIMMSNGRTRFAGSCSQPGCTGKISKIIS